MHWRQIPIAILSCSTLVGCGGTTTSTGATEPIDASIDREAGKGGHSGTDAAGPVGGSGGSAGAYDAGPEATNDSAVVDVADASEDAPPDSEGFDAADAAESPTCDLLEGQVTKADAENYLYDNPAAWSACLGMHACGFLEPGPDDNAVFIFQWCLLINADDTVGRVQRQACAKDWAGSCDQLQTCVSATYEGAEWECSDGQKRLVMPNDEVVGGYSCARVKTGGACDSKGQNCVPCELAYIKGCGTPPDRCESEQVALDCRLAFGPGGQDVTYPLTCGPGYHCVSEYNGPTSYWAKCDGDGANYCPQMGFVCEGTTLRVCTEAYARFSIDCLDYGFKGCSDGKCTW